MGFWDAPPGGLVDPGLPHGYAPPVDPLILALMQGTIDPTPGYRQLGGSMVKDPAAIAQMDKPPQPWSYGQQWALSRPHTADPYAGMTTPGEPDIDFGGGPVAPEPGQREALKRQLQMQQLESYDPEAGSYTRPDRRWLEI